MFFEPHVIQLCHITAPAQSKGEFGTLWNGIDLETIGFRPFCASERTQSSKPKEDQADISRTPAAHLNTRLKEGRWLSKWILRTDKQGLVTLSQTWLPQSDDISIFTFCCCRLILPYISIHDISYILFLPPRLIEQPVLENVDVRLS